MKTNQINVIIGVILVLMPLMGFPGWFKSLLVTIAGLALIGMVVYKKRKFVVEKENKEL